MSAAERFRHAKRAVLWKARSESAPSGPGGGAFWERKAAWSANFAQRCIMRNHARPRRSREQKASPPGAPGTPSNGLSRSLLVLDSVFGDIASVFEAIEDEFELRMSTRGVCFVRDEVLLRNVGDIGRVVGFGEHVVVGLILARSDFRGNREPPFFRVIEQGVDVEDHAPKRAKAMLHDFTDPELRFSHVSPNCIPVSMYRSAQHLEPKIADPKHVRVRVGIQGGIR